MLTIHSFVRTVRLLPIVVVAVLVGCGGSGPEFHALSGRVTLSKGNPAALSGCTVEVALVNDSSIRAFGEIRPDGRFVLQSLCQGEIREGLPEGRYTARIIPNDEDGSTLRRAAKVIAPKYLKFETWGLTLDVPTGNEVTMTLSSR